MGGKRKQTYLLMFLRHYDAYLHNRAVFVSEEWVFVQLQLECLHC